MNSNPELLRRAWTQQLYCEYERILWIYKIKVSPCVIQIKDTQTQLGSWDSDTRTISLSYSFILKNSWNVVLEILKHEMAHQIVSEHFVSEHGRQVEDAHGAHFKKVCSDLGMENWAKKARIDFIDDIPLKEAAPSSEEESRLMRQVEKLLSLAQSPHENEAVAAMKKVRELYELYHLDKIKENKDSHYETVYILFKKKRVEAYQTIIGSILRKHFFVRIIHSSLFDQEDCQVYKAMELLGSREDALMAEYVYWFLENNLRLMWEQYKTERERSERKTLFEFRPPIKAAKNTLILKRSFYRGVLVGFMEKLASQQKRSTANPRSGQVDSVSVSLVSKNLLAVSAKKLLDYQSYKHPRLQTLYQSGARIHSSSYEEGKNRGFKMNLNKPLSTKGNRTVNYIE